MALGHAPSPDRRPRPVLARGVDCRVDLSEIADRAVAVPRPERLHPATIDDVDMIDIKTYAARENISRQAAMKRLDRGKVRGRQDANGKWWLAS